MGAMDREQRVSARHVRLTPPSAGAAPCSERACAGLRLYPQPAAPLLRCPGPCRLAGAKQACCPPAAPQLTTASRRAPAPHLSAAPSSSARTAAGRRPAGRARSTAGGERERDSRWTACGTPCPRRTRGCEPQFTHSHGSRAPPPPAFRRRCQALTPAARQASGRGPGAQGPVQPAAVGGSERGAGRVVVPGVRVTGCMGQRRLPGPPPVGHWRRPQLNGGLHCRLWLASAVGCKRGRLCALGHCWLPAGAAGECAVDEASKGTAPGRNACAPPAAPSRRHSLPPRRAPLPLTLHAWLLPHCCALPHHSL